MNHLASIYELGIADEARTQQRADGDNGRRLPASPSTRSKAQWWSLAAIVALGCGTPGSDRNNAVASLGASGIDLPDDESSDSVGSGTSEGGSVDDGGGRLDLPGPGLPTDGCNAVDLLFVIDNSGSMCAQQEGLASVVPDLVDAMFDSLPLGTDLHVGIVTSSFSDGGSHQEALCAANEGPAIIEEHYITDHPVVGNGYQGRLLEYDERSYFAARTHDDRAREDLMDWFAGAIISVGCDGGAFDFPVAAAAYAVDPVNAPTNGGFVRDEGAALAVFVLTNETDHSPEGLSTYRDMLVDAKAGCGGEACIVTGGLLAPNCVPEWDPPVWQFLSAFGDAPAWGDIGDFSGYRTVVAETLANGVIETCGSIDPVG
ncbi:MAG: hypothetical protein K0V04_08650 [Deltaproteobacteria bacterium]|nr:hypothetical protein [Deltaproteobacteria bacterium]